MEQINNATVKRWWTLEICDCPNWYARIGDSLWVRRKKCIDAQWIIEKVLPRKKLSLSFSFLKDKQNLNLQAPAPFQLWSFPIQESASFLPLPRLSSDPSSTQPEWTVHSAHGISFREPILSSLRLYRWEKYLYWEMSPDSKEWTLTTEKHMRNKSLSG